MIRSRLAGVVMAATIGALPIVPPQHAHETGEHGQAHIVLHRHAEPHDIAPHIDHRPIFDHAEDDAPVLTLEVVCTLPAAPHVMSALPLSVATVEPVVLQVSHRSSPYVELLIHGPPRAPASPRAPPPFAFL